MKAIKNFFAKLTGRIINFKFNFENFVLLSLGAGFFIGIWHALPLLTVINDEQIFVGGIFRAMDNWSLISNYLELPYGILTYLVNYLFFAVFLLVSFPFFHFNVATLKIFLIQSPEIMYLLARLISAVLAIAYLFIINKILKKEIIDKKTRIFLLILIFTNMLTIIILHTVKVWVLGMLLVIISFYYLYRILCMVTESDKINQRRNIFLSILFAFLATANFSLNAFTLINVPIIFFLLKRDKKIFWILVQSVIVGLAAYLLLALLDYAGFVTHVKAIFSVYAQAGREVAGYGVPYSIFMNLKKILSFCPLILLTLVLVVRNKIRDRNLLIISLSYFVVYLLMISAVATWASDGLYYYIRYIFPFGFFLVFIIASFEIKFKKIFIVIGTISIIYYLFTLYFLSVLTTYNQAESWVVNNLNDQNNIIYNNISTIQFRKNKESSLLTQEYFCASKCQSAIANDLNNDFKPLIIDEHTIESYQPGKGRNIYYIVEAANNNQQWKLEKTFGNGAGLNFSIEGRIANYFDFDYFKIRNFGPNIYIYQQQ